MKSDTITCSFVMNRETYNAYKEIVIRNGENVKGNLVRHMQSVIQYAMPNSDTIQAIQEVQKLKQDPAKQVYSSFSELLEEMEESDKNES